MDHKQAASLAGLAPVARQSGTWRGKSFIRGGRAHLRQALYMPALVAARFNPDLEARLNAMTRAGKPAKIAITAIMRRLVVLIVARNEAEALKDRPAGDRRRVGKQLVRAHRARRSAPG